MTHVIDTPSWASKVTRQGGAAGDASAPVRDAMVQLAREGLPPKDIAALSNRRPDNVTSRLAEARRLGIDVPRFQTADEQRLSTSAQLIVERRRFGASNAAIAKELQITERSLEERIRRMRRSGINVPRRGPRGRPLTPTS